jgi:hypothetical protein
MLRKCLCKGPRITVALTIYLRQSTVDKCATEEFKASRWCDRRHRVAARVRPATRLEQQTTVGGPLIH